ncbi:hypothetical protein [Microbacterium sp. APC 3901]|uniref:hypothetical protein n=1 Tax=Microbacterium sp. APC 3901 TaxID=3035192 RepID=UPI0025B4CB49|nr:hypothetical protein [Microbacterium sp. APC 3901]MDN3444668.1 hypothetical protein [Microbacterium sp. APC 3901]
MRPEFRDAANAAFVVTIVVDMPITKLHALDVIAFASDSAIRDARTASPRVPLSPDAWAEVQIPRFADPPPIAIDVCSDASFDVARAAADRLTEALVQVGWPVRARRSDEI